MKPWEKYASETPAMPAQDAKPWEKYQAPVAEEVPQESMAERLPRAAGLTARVGVEAIPELAGGLAGLVNTAGRINSGNFTPQGLVVKGVNMARDALGFSDGAEEVSEAANVVSNAGRNAADFVGLPQPETSAERVISTGGKAAVGTGGIMAGASKLQKAVSPAMQTITRFLSAAPKQQIAGAVGSGVAGQAAKENGAGFGGQLAASVAGGLTLAGLANKGANVAKTVASNIQQNNIAANVLDDVQIGQVDDYLTKQGVDISALSNAAKAKAREFAFNSMRLGENPTSSVNQGVLSSLPVPIKGTKGQISQDFLQQDNERVLADTFFGKPIRNRFEEQQTQLSQNLDSMIGNTKGQTASIKDMGEQLQGEALKRYNKAKLATRNAYKEAESVAGDSLGKPSDNLLQWLDYNQGFKDVDGLITKAQKLGIVAKNEKGELIAGDAPLRNFYELRKTISQHSQNNGALAEAKNLVDDTFEAYGGDLYRDAAKLRREQGVTFESGTKSVRDLVAIKKGTTDQAINKEDVFNKVVINGNRDDIRNIKKLMLSGDKSERIAGKQQIENLKKQTLSYIKDQSVTDANGKTNFSLAQLEKAYKRIGAENLEEVLGKKAKSQLDDFMQAATIINKQQPRSAGNSATASRLANMASSVFNMLDKVPVVGPPMKIVGGGTVKAIQASNATKDQMKLLAKKTPRGEKTPLGTLYGSAAIQDSDD